MQDKSESDAFHSCQNSNSLNVPQITIQSSSSPILKQNPNPNLKQNTATLDSKEECEKLLSRRLTKSDSEKTLLSSQSSFEKNLMSSNNSSEPSIADSSQSSLNSKESKDSLAKPSPFEAVCLRRDSLSSSTDSKEESKTSKESITEKELKCSRRNSLQKNTSFVKVESETHQLSRRISFTKTVYRAADEVPDSKATLSDAQKVFTLNNPKTFVRLDSLRKSSPASTVSSPAHSISTPPKRMSLPKDSLTEGSASNSITNIKEDNSEETANDLSNGGSVKDRMLKLASLGIS